jgi:hypothetical protein
MYKTILLCLLSGVAGILIHFYTAKSTIVPGAYTYLITKCENEGNTWTWEEQEGFLLGYCKSGKINRIIMPPVVIHGDVYRDTL